MALKERPIDRGWAWVICFGVAVNSMFFSGPLRSYGILFVEIQRRFKVSSTLTSIVLAMISVGMAITSPGAATFGERYGQRRVIAVGAVLMFLAAFLTVFAPNVIFIAIVFGGLTGLGLGMVFTPSVVMNGYYFEKRRSLANGISSAGGSIGQLTIPVVFTYLIDYYGFQGGLLIFSALLLHVIPASMLLRPVTCYLPLKKATDIKEDTTDGKVAEDPLNNTCIVSNGRDVPQITCEDYNGKKQELPLLKFDRIANEEETKSLRAFPVHLREDSNLDKEKGNSMPFLDKLHVRNNLKDDISQRGSSYFLPTQQLSPEDTLDGVHSRGKETDDDVIKSKRGRVVKALCFCCDLYEWSMFKDKTFVLYAIQLTLCQSGYISVCMFLPPFAEEKGIERYNIALLLSIAGAVTFFGRIGGGWFADMKLIERPNLTGICVIIIGVAAGLLPFAPVYPAMIAFAVILGFVGGTFVALIVPVVIDLMGIEKMSSTFGLSLMVSGLVTIPLPLLLGFLKDVSGTFDWSIRVCSVLLIAGGCVTFFTQHYVTKKRAKAALTM